jgi:hypothetical protein
MRLRQIIPIFMVILLAGCGHNLTISPTKVCAPPADLLTKYGPLDPLPVVSLTQTDLMSHWVGDIQKYNILNYKDNGLVDWVNKYCVDDKAK